MNGRGAAADRIRGLYGIVDLRAGTAESLLPLADALLAGGTGVLQLRAKSAPAREILDAARALRTKTREAGALLVLNDRLDLALACGADGVHVGQDDLPAVRVRAAAPPEFLVGLSTHSPEQAGAAGDEVDYIGYGPIFPTGTKADAEAARGIDSLAMVTDASRLPVVAIGGLEEAHAHEIARAGAAAMAMIGAAERAPDASALARRIGEVFRDR